MTEPGTCASTAPADVVDVILDMKVPSLPRGFEEPLFREVARLLPWLPGLAGAGIHPMRGTPDGGGGLLFAHRAKLVIRLPREKVCAASVLEGASLSVEGAQLRLGQGTYRRLQAAATLYSPRVVTGDADETAFLARIEEEMASLGARGRLLCGRRTTFAAAGAPETAWSLAVHDLPAADSLALQRRGLGRMRHLGCGIFVPHKTIQTAD